MKPSLNTIRNKKQRKNESERKSESESENEHERKSKIEIEIELKVKVLMLRIFHEAFGEKKRGSTYTVTSRLATSTVLGLKRRSSLYFSTHLSLV